ncbi:alpha/beta hydrolase [Streptomyces sp. NPDC004732]|uniref:alpha/beta fold hydrolase n=1 Tax=Streptomyces sp. NPDC004732 TaxID=3154290 RepID=UPI0033B03E61
MRTFTAPDGTELAYHLIRDGGEGDASSLDVPPVVCLPGGPMQASAYLGDLGGLAARRPLLMLDLRGTGDSAVPEDRSSYRCDRLVDDVEALRVHLGLEVLDLLAHSGGTNLAVLYAARHPERVGRLALITPSVMAVGIPVDGSARREAALLRRDEPWFPTAFAALEAIVGGGATAEAFQAIAPFAYGRWDAEARAHRAAEDGQRNDEAAAAFGAEGAYDPEATRAALAKFGAPVLVLAGQADLNSPPPAMTELAGLFPDVELVVQPGAGHFPWLHDPAAFAASTGAFLT